MADLGVIAENGSLTKDAAITAPWAHAQFFQDGSLTKETKVAQPWRWRCLNLDSQYECLGGRDDLIGNPLPPSLRIKGVGRWRFRCRFEAGLHEVSIRVLQSVNQSPRPTLTVKANPEIGLLADVVAVAPNGTDWMTAVADFATTVKGATWIELATYYDDDPTVESHWDHFLKS